ncbi:DNA-binding SARP family transcriptional activator [Krasilnikovia cinnamomea]|uniref:DNA-binding SARP family transcriptional activator n=1 Tax=Krasilnikovia cinnamomea TaxID=349313 RepID=A0A4Q7ZKJ1_9ACTN|nr:BTAD domain-containing putative transcriptional regulator [Krasilnikovia cinnamomea]RZU50699.1 DNA-binding SARP family transcriptional activator [Krasilnikovia cinnamomea]
MDFRVLGPIRLHTAGGSIGFGEPRRQAVLAVLLFEAGRTVDVDVLVDRVWGESPPRQVRRSLQAHITRIRRALEQADPGSTYVAREAGGYRLVVRPEQVDVHRFRNALRNHPTDAATLRSALSLWYGEPLAGLRGHWVERTRRTLREEHAAAVVAWAEAEIRGGGAASTITQLTELTDEYPLRETAAAALMRALYAVDRGADALAQYERTRRVLREELGADPGPELAAVHGAILRHDPRLTATVRAAVPAQLPADITAFTGRAEELAELDRLTGRTGDEPVVIGVTGTAGSGKTATVVHWCHRERSRFPDGQLYLDLCGYDPGEPLPPTEALAMLLTALLPAGAKIPLRPEERAARFRTEVSARRMLVVLDNAATVEQVRPLLPGTSTCVVMVTSRDSLAGLVALHGAHRVQLDRLPAADSVALLGRLIGDRVTAAPEAAAALAERCVRLPLTLRLAAEHAVSRPTTSLARLVDELQAAQRALDLLSGGDDQRAAVRVVFSWSLRRLSPAARRSFAALGRHPAPLFDAYALAALAGCPLDEARRQLDVLVRAHLIHPAGADRFGMHDLLKAYAAETGDDFDAHTALDRVYGYYLATVSAAMDCLYPGEAHRRPSVAAPVSPVPAITNVDVARDWLGTELPAVQALVARAVTRGRPEHAVTLSALLFRYLDGHHQAVALAINRDAQAAARATGDRAAEANARIALGGVHHQAGRIELAAAEMWAAHTLFEEVGDVLGQARALGNVGMLTESAGRYPRAAYYYARALTLFQQVGDVTGQAHVLTRLGTVEVRMGDGTAGRQHLDEAKVLHRRAGHRFGEAWVKMGLGELAAVEGRPAEAVRLHSEAARTFAELGHGDSEAWAIDGRGRAESLSGHPFTAADQHRQALEQFRRHGDQVGESWALNGLGEACQADGYPAMARSHHAEALVVATRAGCQEQIARARRGLARAAAPVDTQTARQHYDHAIAIYTELGLSAVEATRAELAILT